MIKTIDVSNTETAVELYGGVHVRIKNLGSGTVYVSKSANVVAESDGVKSIQSGTTDIFPNVATYLAKKNDYYGVIYIFADTDCKIELETTHNPNFRQIVKGGDDNTDCKIIIEYIEELPENVKQSTIYLVNTENGYLEYVGSKPLGYLQTPKIPEILRQPSDCYTRSGTTAEFNVEAIGKDLTYQWQYSSNGEKWFNSTVATGNEKNVLIPARTDTAKNDYRCVITDGYGNQVISNVVNIILTNVSTANEEI